MKNRDNLTAQEFITWCVTALSALNDGPEFDEINKNFMMIIEQIEHLEACLKMDPYDKEK